MNTKRTDTVNAEKYFKDKFGRLTFGEALKALRLSDEISQTDFAEKLGVSRQYLCDLEAGRKSISVAKAAKFAKLLKQSKEVFITLAIQDELERYKLPFTVSLAEKPRKIA